MKSDMGKAVELALKNGNLEQVRKLLDRGEKADESCDWEHDVRPLQLAVEKGNADLAALLLEHGADPDFTVKGAVGKRPLLLGALYRPALALLLLRHGARLKFTIPHEGEKLTPLLFILEKFSDEKAFLPVVEALVEHGDNLRAKRRNGDTPLHAACRAGLARTASFLVSRGADLRARNKDGHTPLQTAWREGKDDAARALVEAGADIMTIVKDGKFLLHRLCHLGLESKVAERLAAGADPGLVDENGFTPLMYAARNGDAGIARLLVEKGAAVDAGANGVTPVLVAAQGGRLAVLKFLVARGASLTGEDGTGIPVPALAVAAEAGRLDCVTFILEEAEKKKPVERAFLGDLLHSALDHPHEAVAVLLVERGAAVETVADGKTPLMRACEKGLDDLAALLIKKGADVNARPAAWWTPLLLAAWGGHLTLVKRLLDRGADRDAVLGDGFTAFRLASLGNHRNVMQLLVQKGAAIGTGIERLYFTRGDRDSASEIIARHIAVRIAAVSPARVLITGAHEPQFMKNLAGCLETEAKGYSILSNDACSLGWLCRTVAETKKGGKPCVIISNFPRQADPPTVHYLKDGVEMRKVTAPPGTSLSLLGKSAKKELVLVFIVGLYAAGYLEAVYASQAAGREKTTLFQMLTSDEILYLKTSERKALAEAKTVADTSTILAEITRDLEKDPECPPFMYGGGILME